MSNRWSGSDSGADLSAGQECGVVLVEVRQEDSVRPITLGPGAAKIDTDEEARRNNGQNVCGWDRPAAPAL